MAWVGVAKAWRGDTPGDVLYDMTTLAESVVSMAYGGLSLELIDPKLSIIQPGSWDDR